MNVNIFLKQFKCSHSEIISMIESGDMNAIGSERLRGLQKILPEADEVLFLNNVKVINLEITLFHDLKNINKLDLCNILFKAFKTLF